MLKYLTRHLSEVDETWLEHLFHASGLGLRLLVAGLACLAHAVFPFLFQATASRLVRSLQRDFETRSARTTRTDASLISASTGRQGS